MANLVVSVLPVGQGAMNLIEGYNDDGKLKHLGLIDCGTIAESGQAKNKSIEYVQDKMMKRFESDGVFFDVVIISHRDKDHLNLFSEIIGRYIFEKSVCFEEEAVGCTNIKIINPHKREIHEIHLSSHNYVWSQKMHFTCQNKNCIIKYDQSEGKLSFLYRWRVDKFLMFSELIMFLEYENRDLLGGLKSNVLKRTIFFKVVAEQQQQQEKYFVCYSDLNGKRHKEQLRHRELPEKKVLLFDIYNFLIKKLGICSYELHKDVINESINLAKEMPYNLEKINTLKSECTVYKKKWIGRFIVGGNIDYISDEYNKVQQLGSVLSSSYYDQNFSELTEYIGLETEYCFNYDVHRINLLVLQSYNFGKIMNSELDWHINNLTSAVAAINSDHAYSTLDKKYFFSGDITRHTVYYFVNEKILKNMENALWTAPHHGSFHTMINKEEGKNPNKYIKMLLTFYKPRGMIISAGYNSKFGHPHKSFVETVKQDFIEKKLVTSEHCIFYNNNDEEKNPEWVHTLERVPIYTCVAIFESDNYKYYYQRLYENSNQSEGVLSETMGINCIIKNTERSAIPDKNMFI